MNTGPFHPRKVSSTGILCIFVALIFSASLIITVVDAAPPNRIRIPGQQHPDRRGLPVQRSAAGDPVPTVVCDVLIVGGSLGAVAAAHEAAISDPSVQVCLAADDIWLGGQATSQGVSALDEALRDFSLTYALFRKLVREYYATRNNVSSDYLHQSFDGGFNPGQCWVSALCYEPKVGRMILERDILGLNVDGPAFRADMRSQTLPNLRVVRMLKLIAVISSSRENTTTAPVDDSPPLGGRLHDDGERVLAASTVITGVLFRNLSAVQEPIPPREVSDQHRSGSRRPDRRLRAGDAASDDVEFVLFQAKVTIDATDLGDLFPLAKVAYRLGTDSNSDTGEPSAPATNDSRCVQPMTYVFLLERRPDGQSFVIPEPPYFNGSYYSLEGYHMFASGSPSFSASWRFPFSFWTYRRAVSKEQLQTPFDVALINWDGNDFNQDCPTEGCSIVDQDPATQQIVLNRARDYSLGFCYWLQTAVPRDPPAAEDGDSSHPHPLSKSAATGYPNLRLSVEAFDTSDGLSRFPYIREGRRLRAVTTIREQDAASSDQSSESGAIFHWANRRYSDSVGIVRYQFDIHSIYPPECNLPAGVLRAGSAQIPLGSLIPESADGLLAGGGKNIGSTHITNGMYRVHPSEWHAGQAAGALATFTIANQLPSQRIVLYDESLLRRFQQKLLVRGAPLYWWADHSRSVSPSVPASAHLNRNDTALFTAAQMLGVQIIFLDFLNGTLFSACDGFTRREAAMLLVRAMRVPPVPPLSSTSCVSAFDDVACTDIGYGEIQRLAQWGITSGCAQRRFCPDEMVTRSAFVQWLVTLNCSRGLPNDHASSLDDGGDPTCWQRTCNIGQQNLTSYIPMFSDSSVNWYAECASRANWISVDDEYSEAFTCIMSAPTESMMDRTTDDDGATKLIGSDYGSQNILTHDRKSGYKTRFADSNWSSMGGSMGWLVAPAPDRSSISGRSFQSWTTVSHRSAALWVWNWQKLNFGWIS